MTNVPFAVNIRRGLVYGAGRIGFGCPEGSRERALELDVYEPAASGDGHRPAVVLAFGGAFHRGSRIDDSFGDGAGQNTSIADYCRWLASLGYVAFSIDYRLVPEDPVPGETRSITAPDEIPTSRTVHVRNLLGLPPATSQLLWRGVEAAIDDMAAAFRYVEANHDAWRIDPARIAIGGFSAGARMALYAAFAEKIPAAAVISLSGFMASSDLSCFVTGAPPDPPVLLVRGEHDLDFVAEQTPRMLKHFDAVGLPVVSYSVPGAGHFYSKDAVTDGTCSPTVGACIASFLHEIFEREDRSLAAHRNQPPSQCEDRTV